MKPKHYFFLLVLYLIPLPLPANDVIFLKMNEYILLDIDQHDFCDAIILPDQFFTLWFYGSPHTSTYYMKIVKIDRYKVPHSLEERSNCICGSIYNQIWVLNYGYANNLPIEQKLKNRLIPSGDYFYVPDNSGQSYCFTMQGTYENLVPNPEFIKQALNSTISIQGKETALPVQLQGITYTKIITLDKTILLISDNQYATVGKEDLNSNGEKAIFHNYNYKSSQSYLGIIKFFPLKSDNILIYNPETQSNKLFKATPQQELSEVNCQIKPGIPYAAWSYFLDGKYYQIEMADFSLYLKIVEYSILNLPGVSHINNFEYNK